MAEAVATDRRQWRATHRYARLSAEVGRLMEGYNFGEAGRQIHDFLWGEFADWYVEIAKVQLEQSSDAQQATRAQRRAAADAVIHNDGLTLSQLREEVGQLLTSPLF